MSREARKHPRNPVWLPIGIDGEGRPNRIGVSRDASLQGLLISTGSKFSVGERLTLRIRLAENRGEVMVRGKVVRVENETGKSAMVYPYRVAVQLDRPVHALQRQFESEDIEEIEEIDDDDLEEIES